MTSTLGPLGITFEDLKQRGFVTAPTEYRKHLKEGFRTPSGKIELASGYMEMLGYDPLPYAEEPPESPISSPELAARISSRSDNGWEVTILSSASEHRQIASLRKHHRDPLLEIHPQTAKKYGIEDGDWVWIETPRGRIQQKARLTDSMDSEGCQRGVCMVVPRRARSRSRGLESER